MAGPSGRSLGGPGPLWLRQTTLLYLLAGLRFPQSGEILINGSRLTKPRPHTGLILQDYGLLPWATVSENASLGCACATSTARMDATPLQKQRSKMPPAQADHWLDRLGLAEFKDKYPGQISGGQRQRAAIARTLAPNPTCC